MSVFDRIARGLEAAQQTMGSDELARTHGFELTHSSLYPFVVVRRRRSNGEILVDVAISETKATMTVAEFERFVEELIAFRPVVQGAAQAAGRQAEGG